MSFPHITHIDEVLPYVKDKKEFNVSYRDECITIDYVYQDEDTFSHPILKECRGIKFNKDGWLIARPFHKFFNHGERKEEEKGYDFNQATLYEKLDGSLIHFIEYEGKIRACTKAGITDVSRQAEDELQLTHEFKEKMRGFINSGLTLCFEYTSPKNRIVIRYDQPKLTLLGVRENHSGEYFKQLDLFKNTLGVPAAKIYESTTIENVKEWVDSEGVVVVWPDGYRMKLKADDYVLKHKVKDQLFREHNVLQMVLNDQTDDLVGILDDEDYQKVVEYKHKVYEGISKTTDYLQDVLDGVEGLERKEVAKKVIPSLPKPLLPMFWMCYDGRGINETVKQHLLKNSNKQANVDNMREVIGADWVI